MRAYPFKYLLIDLWRVLFGIVIRVGVINIVIESYRSSAYRIFVEGLIYRTFAVQNYGPYNSRGVAELHRIVLKNVIVILITKKIRIESNIKVGRIRFIES